MIKNIIFNLENVLLKFKPLDNLKAPLYKEVFQGEEWLHLDRGILTQGEAIDIISSRNPNHEVHIKRYTDNWIDILIPTERTIKLLSELK